MKRILNVELERAFRNPRYLIIIALALACFVIGSYRSPTLTFSPDFPLHPVNRLTINLYYGGFSLLAALLATLPYADSFLTDREQGFLRLIVQRTQYRKYLMAKVVAVALAGGASLLLGLLVIFLLGIIASTDWSATVYSWGSLTNGVPRGPFGWLYGLHPFYYLLYLLLSTFGFGAVYALLGLAVSTIISNRYIVLAAPLVFVQVLSFLESRSLRLTPVFNPINSLIPFDAYEGFLPIEQLVQTGMVLGLSLLAVLILARKSRLLL